jgi:hypothetical protein
VDLFGDCDDDRLLQSLRILDRDPNTDVIVVALYFQVPYLSEYLTERLADLNQELTKPLIVSPRGFSDFVYRSRRFMNQKNFQSYTVPMVKPLALATRIWEKYDTNFLAPRNSQ